MSVGTYRAPATAEQISGRYEAAHGVTSYVVDTGVTTDWPGEPTLHDRLLYRIGRVCEVHVLLDWNLGILQAELAILTNPSDPEEAFRPELATASRIGRCKGLFVRVGAAGGSENRRRRRPQGCT